MPVNIFEIKDLSFSYGNNKVIDGLNLKIKEGKITTLIGANGCGKSTLFNLMTKNLKPNNGEIFLAGQSVEQMKLKDFARKAAIVHQYNTAPPDITVEKLVKFGRTPYHTMGLSSNPEEDREKVKFALEITDTEKFKDKPVSQLSGGQKQRVWIAMALAQDTKILFFDEPTTYLDIRYQLQILRLVKRLNSEFNITVIMVLHDINQSLYYSDEIVAMHDGKIRSQGIPKEIITPKLIEDVYGVTLETGEIDGKPFVMPV
ncbi:ABC transporter ATP-binding protein [Ruminococcus bromii]|uniref:ABC transporter ATP-binding protein n=1 Tax=Ruminococcus bromii TaxID=40518 RepID=UPI00265CBACA|nr:ABC transporter ATP-binding protein [Ruminococcus bromii]